MKGNKTIQRSVKNLLQIVSHLRKKFPIKRFTLDGRLLGDIGEILVQSEFRLSLNEGVTKHHDATTRDGRQVQIKATMKDALTFPGDHTPKYYLGIKIDETGKFRVIFNGPAKIIRKAIKNRKLPKTNLHSIGIRKLGKLNEDVLQKDRIPQR